MPAFAGMTNVDGRDEPGHDELIGGIQIPGGGDFGL